MSGGFDAQSLIADLPALRGRLTPQAPLAAQSWFRVGGPAELLFRPADVEDLAALLQRWPGEWPVSVLGAASNVIIRDGGIAGLVIRLGRGFAEVEIEEDGLIAGSAVLDITLAEHAASAGLTGVEFLSGIPGTIGVVVRARLRAQPGDPAKIAARMAEIKASREATQPVRARTGGSTFRNPPDMKAWELIDAAGCRGLRLGDAQISDKHCNFMLNLGEATAAELENLGEMVRERVMARSGITLEWEIKRLGRKLTSGETA